MIKTKTSLVFFGSGPVASKSIELLSKHFIIEAIITKPSHKSDPNPVMEFAKKAGIKIYTPLNKEELSKQFLSNKFVSEIGLVIDYGIIISQSVISSFPKGILNSHFSLLPQWRGPDPITFAILSGQGETGVSIMIINDRMDEGQLLAQCSYKMSSDTTGPSLTQSLIEISYELLVKTIPAYLGGEIQPYMQDSTTEPTYSRKLTKDDGKIDWEMPAEVIERQIRAFIEWPRSYTTLYKQLIIISKARVAPDRADKLGKFVVEPKRLFVQCKKNSLEILSLRPSGKRDMSAEAFIAGYKRFLV